MTAIGTIARNPVGTIEVSVLHGDSPQQIYRRIDGALFVAGLPGLPYTLRVRNLTSGRIEVINTVDGRHTLKDEPGDSERNRGLIFAAHSTGAFTGWRLNNDETRQFVFGAPDRSVAAMATGSASNTGVIGFAAYRERELPATAFASYGNSPILRGGGASFAAAASFDSNMASKPAGDAAPRGLGTGMGERQSDHVGTTTFTRAAGSPDILVIGYDTEDALRAMGVMGPPEPSAFPGAGTGYEKYAAQA